MTDSWLRTFIHAYKNASFMDKFGALRQEPNPYYVLEWLLLPCENNDSEESFWDEWKGQRTAGLQKGTQLEMKRWFMDQFLYELIFGTPVSDAEAALAHTAFADLAARYGEERWQNGEAAFRLSVQNTLDHYAEFQSVIDREWKTLNDQWEKTMEELQEEAEEYEEGSFDLEEELRLARAKWEKKREEAPLLCLQREFPDDPLLHYVVQRRIDRPVKRLEVNIQSLFSGARPAERWLRVLEEGVRFEEIGTDPQSLSEPQRNASAAASVTALWLSALAAKSDITRRSLPIEERQRQALRYIDWCRTKRAEKSDDAAELETMLFALLRYGGWELLLAEDEFVPSLLNTFVWYALPHEEYRKRLREEVVLKAWDTFVNRFMTAEVDWLEQLAWVFVLDPESVQQRLLRHRSTEIAESVVHKLCALYAEGIRRGIDPAYVAALFEYLAKHDREAFYGFVHGSKTLPEALAMFELPASVLASLFRGEGVRQSSARKHLLALLYQWLTDLPESESSFEAKGKAKDRGGTSRQPLPAKAYERLVKLCQTLAYDKRTAVGGWLDRQARDGRWSSGGEGPYALTRLLKFRWLGTKGSEAEQHQAVKEWLERRSDWVQFETDAPLAAAKGVAYRIVRPGAIDAESGELLARVVVRAEWSEPEEVKNVLDDLKSL